MKLKLQILFKRKTFAIVFYLSLQNLISMETGGLEARGPGEWSTDAAAAAVRLLCINNQLCAVQSVIVISVVVIQ